MSPRSYIFLLLLWFCQRRRRQKLKAFLLRSHQALLLCSCSSSPVLILLHLLVFLAFLYFPGIRSYREKNFFGEFFPNLECFFFFNYHLPPCSFILYRGGGCHTVGIPGISLPIVWHCSMETQQKLHFDHGSGTWNKVNNYLPPQGGRMWYEVGLYVYIWFNDKNCQLPAITVMLSLVSMNTSFLVQWGGCCW